MIKTQKTKESQKSYFVDYLIEWFDSNGRKYPWRTTKDPYKVFIAEFMLQRTGGPQVEPVYKAFIKKYPTLDKAIKATKTSLKEILYPLGRTDRYKMLFKALRVIKKDFASTLPDKCEDLKHIPGIGEYTARAILCFAFGKKIALLDPGIFRLTSRFFGVSTKKVRPHTDKELWQFVDSIISDKQAGKLNLAMLDYAALICRSKKPKCLECPLFQECSYAPQSEAAKAPTLIDLFSGAGGLAEGFRQAGFRSVFAVEINSDAADTYEANFGRHVFRNDISKLKTVEQQVDVIVGGPPCQGFSPLGKMTPAENHGDLKELWKEYLRIVEQVKPKAFLVENVPEFLTSMQVHCFEQEVAKLGYNTIAGKLHAVDFGVPQKRKRGFVIGLLGAKPTLPEGRFKKTTVKDAIGDLPPQPTEENWHIGRNPTEKSKQRYACIPPGGNRFDLMKKRPDICPQCWLRKLTGSTDVFGRLEWDKPSLTIRTEFFKPEKGRYLHPSIDRPITHREAARLQTFPDSFIFKGSKIQVARQIGNAVPPRLAKALGKHILKLLNKKGLLEGTIKK